MKLYVSLIKKNTRSSAIAKTLLMQIATGRYRPGAQLPSYRAIAFRHGVSDNIARRALYLLCKENLVYVKPGIGHFVTEPKTQETSPDS
jgi:DNA-binding transcriptional regulator YhcF (GntR family)